MLKIKLTPKQKGQLSRATSSKIPVTLTSEQYKLIKGRFPNLATRKMTITLVRGTIAAPFLPGGAVLSAAVSGLSEDGGAIASVSAG